MRCTKVEKPSNPDRHQCADIHTYRWGNIIRGIKESDICQIGICIRCGFTFKRGL